MAGEPGEARVRLRGADGTYRWFLGRVVPLRDDAGQIRAWLGTCTDIDDEATAQRALDTQVLQLSALRAIDRSITGSSDLDVTLGMIVDKVHSTLGFDAAAILLLDPVAQTLEYAAGSGFSTREIRRTRIRLGEGAPGRSARERLSITLRSVLDTVVPAVRPRLFEEEGFVGYAVVPLIAKGDVKGVLEAFRRRPLERDPAGTEFLEAAAGQAAIAIDNARLFEALQVSSTELAIAYDATIEGWSRALDLRDKETEGHSRRVTDMALRMARVLGFPSAGLEHMRRGALLHDIGKMGVPDHILLKPGKLTEDEWEIMRRHPDYARELIEPIEFLRPALNIPYCHHEKWDGSGYPRGLKGEEIPLDARAFAVVDVWDALRSQRPYRAGWPRERILKHLRCLAGTHFDPRAVSAFLEIEREEDQTGAG
jgi:putative nucleotidyltransferase with HDIG domain